MAAISSNKTGIRKALRRLFKKKEDTPVKQDFGISNPETPEEMKKFQEEQDYRRERRQGNKPVNVPKKSIPSVIPAEESPKLKSQKQTKEAKRKEASKPIDEQIKGSVKKKEVKVKSGQDVISDKMSFGKAFRAARNEGMKTFTWRGKKYGTKLKKKEEKKTTTQAATKPSTSSTPSTATKAAQQATGTRNFVQKPQTQEKISSAVGKIDAAIARLQKMQKGAYNSNRAMQIRKLKERKKLAESRTTRGASRPQPQGGETSAQIKRRVAIDPVKVKLAEQKAKLKKLEGAGGKAISEREKAKAQIAALEAQLKKMS